MENDIRDGGKWRFVHADAGGHEHGFHGVFHGDPSPEGVVRTFEYEGAPGHVSMETLTLTDLGGRTLVRTVSSFQAVEDRDAMIASGMERGVHDSDERMTSCSPGCRPADARRPPGARRPAPGYTAPERAHLLAWIREACPSHAHRRGHLRRQYRDWRGPLYPPDLPQRDWLGSDASQYATVENNSTFYRLPPGTRSPAGQARIPGDFVMTIKASRYLTHIKRLRILQALVAKSRPRPPARRPVGSTDQPTKKLLWLRSVGSTARPSRSGTCSATAGCTPCG